MYKFSALLKTKDSITDFCFMFLNVPVTIGVKEHPGTLIGGEIWFNIRRV